MSHQQQETGIKRYESAADVSLAAYAEKYNLLSPTQIVQAISPHHKLSVSIVQIDPSPSSGDVYYSKTFCKEGEVALSKNGVLKLAEAARISWVTEECLRLDDMRNQDFACFQAVCQFKRPDGSWQKCKGTQEVDCALLSAQDRARVRPHKVALAETKAMLRAVRAALTLKQKYTVSELQRPFAVPHLDFSPDYADPEVRRLMLAAATGAQAALYGTQPALPAGEVVEAQAAVEQMRGGRRETVEIPPDATVIEAPQDEDEEDGHDPETGEVDALMDVRFAISTADAAELGKLRSELRETARAGRFTPKQMDEIATLIGARQRALGGAR